MSERDFTQAEIREALASVSDDDLRVLKCSEGTTLRCIKNLVMEESFEQAFTQGRIYRVSAMHPFASPPFVRVSDDQGESHILDGENLREYFGR
ncbi:hypothetical protein NPS53_09235 [Pseudomonas putida]|uniref:hypothetical protein n=1 Tax=Pseudomonas putida TaxID=303 RepID=UPI002363A6C7|nr:hypothetical protein [Pseudomonas putida]MDD2139759.1 hypothetical protein [Pseudomonas putida]HDS1721683.1 hypothetical protein [Pseudomonas putida]